MTTLIAMDPLNPFITSLLILKNDKFGGSLNMNELDKFKAWIIISFLASNNC